jgi:hypothetical protein
VIGAGNESPVSALQQAEEVGRLLAENGAVVVCGGLNGVMEAVSRGARQAGGRTIGILPGDDHESANQWIDTSIPTGLGYARNTVVVKTGDAVIAIAGAFGTLSEIGHAVADNKTVVGLNTWELSREGAADAAIVVADTPAAAVELAIAAAKEARKL